MALIPKFMVVAAERPVASSQTIKMGQIVTLNSSGQVILQTNTAAYGIAGDTQSTTASAMPGIYAGWQNRVSDYFDETKASGKMTVYHSGGEFATDQYSSNVTQATPYTALYANQGLLCTAIESTGSGIVAYLTQTAGAYPSGVPGTDTTTADFTLGYTGTTGDMALKGDNTNQYIEIKLNI